MDHYSYSILRRSDPKSQNWDSPTAHEPPASASEGRRAESELEATLQGLAERARYITGASGVAVALSEGENDEMVCRAACGPLAPPLGSRLQIRSGLSGEAVRTGQPLRCDDADSDERVNRESCQAFGIAAILVMRLTDPCGVTGIFELFSDRSFAFGERETLALKSISRVIQSALEEAAQAGVRLGRIPWAPDTGTDAHLAPEAGHAEALLVEMELPSPQPLPPFLARLADEAEASANRSWSQWFRPQW